MSDIFSTPLDGLRELQAGKNDAELEILLDSKEHHPLELVDGMLVEKLKGARNCTFRIRFGFLLYDFVEKHKLGHLFCTSLAYKCFPGPKLTIRKPDISFIKRGRIPNEELTDENPDIAPDLALEVISPFDTSEYIERKLEDYERAGIPEVWILTRNCTVVVKKGRSTRILEESAELSSDLFPGFSITVRDIFSLPL